MEEPDEEEHYKKVQQSLTESYKKGLTEEEVKVEGVVRLRSKKKKSALVSGTHNESWNPFSSYYSQYLWGRILSWTQPSINHHFSGSEIVDRLWISDHASVCNLTSLQDRKIRYVVCCVLGVQPMFPQNLNYLKVPLIDKEEQDIHQYFDDVADYIDKILRETEWSVIVHCRCGVSRSVTLVCAYLIKYLGMKHDESISFVQKKRPCANPIPSFRHQLRSFHEQQQSKKRNEPKTDSNNNNNSNVEQTQ
jgi:hypothetical protein